MVTVTEKDLFFKHSGLKVGGQNSLHRQNRLKVFLKHMIIWFWVKKDQEIIINGYNAEIKAVRYTQITDDDKDTRNSLYYR